MSKWTIGRRLTVGFGVVLIITSVLGGFAYVKFGEINRLSAIVTQDALPGVYNISQFQAAARQQYVLALQHIYAEDAQAMAQLEQEMREQIERLNAISEAYDKTITRARDRELFDAIKAPRAEFLRVRSERLLPASRANQQAEALEIVRRELDPVYQRYMTAVEASVDDNKQAGDQVAREIEAATATATLGLAIGIVVALIVGCGVAVLIVRSTNSVLGTSVRELADGSRQVAAASSQVAVASQSLSQGSTEQAASLEETSASMEEMSSMTRRNAENSAQAAAMMVEAERVVGDANVALGEMVTSMSAIKTASDEVAKIIRTIDEIAFQTNILALNAAVEAARAGDAGMGFAVVADEVRSLAQRSAQAAKDTAALIEQSIARSDDGQQKVQAVAQSIASITASAAQVKALVDDVTHASRQQAQGIDQVSQAIVQMEKVTQSTAATAEESAAASEELNAQAEAAMAVVGRLSALVGQLSQTPDGAAASARTARVHVPRAEVVAMRKPVGRPMTADEAEARLPLGNTGTYGTF